MPDLTTRQHIETLITQFYQKAMADELIGHFFSDVIALNLDEHLPKICDFWESTLFYKGNYSGNPMQVHIALNQKSKMQPAHFERWLALFNQTIDELFDGPTALLAKTRAQSIATTMQIKLLQVGN
ncbi:MAG: group III truncated hemoglobin [Bacteroidetes bacterium]|nr:group III truncated hemoglobin [Bacteroidota bacterium]